MTAHQIASERVSTPLCEATHKIRGRLLVAASSGIVTFHTGLVPTKIDGLGIEFTPGQQDAIVWSILGLVTYLFLSFVIAVAADIVTVRLQRRSKLQSALLASVSEAVEKGKQGEQHANAWYSAKDAVSKMTHQLHVSLSVVAFLSRIRFLWDAALPVVVGLYSIVVLGVLLCHGIAR